jgi:hypothetical protein
MVLNSPGSLASVSNVLKKLLNVCIFSGWRFSGSVSRWRPQKVDKRMALEYTHGLFIT